MALFSLLQKAVASWPHLSQVKPIVEAFLDIAGSMMVRFQGIRSRIDPMVICRSMAVLLFAPFISSGKSLLAELVKVLGGDASQPAQLITSYADGVLREDISMLKEVNQRIVRYSMWSEWAAAVILIVFVYCSKTISSGV